MRLKVSVSNSTTALIAGWDYARCIAVGTDSNVANLTDWDTSTPTDIIIDTITPFSSDFSGVTRYVTGTTAGWEQEIWGTFNFSDGSVPDPASVIQLRSTSATPDLVPGNSYKVRLGGCWGLDDRDVVYTVNGQSATYNNITQAEPWTPPDPVEIIAVATDDGTGKGVLEIKADYAAGSTRNYLAAIEVTEATSAPTITDINTTNEVTPGEAATLTGTNLTNATGLNIGSVSQTDFTVVSATSVTFTGTRGGNPYNQDLTATLLSPDGNATITVQQVPEAGTFAVTAASPNTTDDASLWSGLVDTATGDPVTAVNGDQFWAKTTIPGLAIQPDGTITADETGTFTGQFWRASEGVWGSDQTVSFVVPGEGDSYPFSKGIKYAAEKNWTWGGRHPKTGMRVRIFK